MVLGVGVVVVVDDDVVVDDVEEEEEDDDTDMSIINELKNLGSTLTEMGRCCPLNVTFTPPPPPNRFLATSSSAPLPNHPLRKEAGSALLFPTMVMDANSSIMAKVRSAAS